MSEEHPFPEDSDLCHGEDTDKPVVTDVEQRLRRARPRPPKLDVEAILRLAQTPEEPARLPCSPSGSRSRRFRGWVATVAGAWLCGAIAGAIATAIILGRAAPPKRPGGSVIVQQERLPKVTEADREDVSGDDARDVQSYDSQPRREESSAVEATQIDLVLLDPYSPWPAAHGSPRPVLRAGVLWQDRVLPADGHSGYETSTSFPHVEEVSYHTDRTPQSVESSQLSEPPLTREHLLQELLGTSPDSVL
jgi:hypothetical protein